MLQPAVPTVKSTAATASMMNTGCWRRTCNASSTAQATRPAESSKYAGRMSGATIPTSVEPSEIARRRFQPGKLAMTEHAGDEQADAEDGYLQLEPVRQPATGERPAHDAQSGRKRRGDQIAAVPARTVEAQNERQQVDRQRYDPQQRDR